MGCRQEIAKGRQAKSLKARVLAAIEELLPMINSKRNGTQEIFIGPVTCVKGRLGYGFGYSEVIECFNSPDTNRLWYEPAIASAHNRTAITSQ